jgi:hypothetical protein
LIKGFSYEGNIDHLWDNEEYVDLIERLDKKEDSYLIGIDLPSKNFNKDFTVITYLKVGADRELTVEGSIRF